MQRGARNWSRLFILYTGRCLEIIGIVYIQQWMFRGWFYDGGDLVVSSHSSLHLNLLQQKSLVLCDTSANFISTNGPKARNCEKSEIKEAQKGHFLIIVQFKTDIMIDTGNNVIE